jgi:hypothetical protein
MSSNSKRGEYKKLLFIFAMLIASVILVTPQKQNTVTEIEAKSYGMPDVYLCGANQTCMDNISEMMLKTRSAKELLAELDGLGRNDSSVLIQCHPITHSIGRTLYKKLLEENKHLADVFKECDHTCHSGCFHGAMERVFFAGGIDGEDHVIPQILREKVHIVYEKFASGLHGNLKFQCLHGLGHAIVFFNNYDLIDSLRICDLLSTDWDASSCYGGAFMENVIASNKSKRYISDDPHFPCNGLEEKYKDACYLMQTSRMLELGLSYRETGEECERTSYRNTCMTSLGRDASNDARKDPKSATICMELGIETDKNSCINGMVYALSDNTLDGRYAFPYCDSLPDDFADYCYTATISYLAKSLYINKTIIMESCKTHSTYPDCIEMVNSV